jgi:hypothetical protein
MNMPHPAGWTTVTLILILMRELLRRDQGGRSYLGDSVLFLLPATRAPVFLGSGLAYGFYALERLFTARDWRPFAIAAAAVVFASTVFLLLLEVGYGAENRVLSFKLGVHLLEGGERVAEHVLRKWSEEKTLFANVLKAVGEFVELAYPWLLGLFVFFSTKPWRIGAPRWPYYFLLAPILILNLVSLELRGGEAETITHAFFIMLSGEPYALWAIAVTALAHAPWSRTIKVALVLFCAAPVAFSSVSLTRFVIDPESGHEFADNRPITRALAAIPVEGSLLVTNDLRYPADDARRDHLQLQLSAIFGHRGYANALRYLRPPDEDERREEMALLSAEKWDPRILELAREKGWTHYVIHKSYPHPPFDQIPLDTVFDDEDYRVYAFPKADAGQGS